MAPILWIPQAARSHQTWGGLGAMTLARHCSRRTSWIRAGSIPTDQRSHCRLSEALMQSRRNPYGYSGPTAWFRIFPAVLAADGVLLGLQASDFHLMNRSAAVFLLAIALACIKDILT